MVVFVGGRDDSSEVVGPVSSIDAILSEEFGEASELLIDSGFPGVSSFRFSDSGTELLDDSFVLDGLGWVLDIDSDDLAVSPGEVGDLVGPGLSAGDRDGILCFLDLSEVDARISDRDDNFPNAFGELRGNGCRSTFDGCWHWVDVEHWDWVDVNGGGGGGSGGSMSKAGIAQNIIIGRNCTFEQLVGLFLGSGGDAEDEESKQDS